MKRLSIILAMLMLIPFFSGCAGKKGVAVQKGFIVPADDPILIGQAYLQALYDKQSNKTVLYGLLSETTQAVIPESAFMSQTAQVSESVDMTAIYMDVTTFDAFLFSDTDVVGYYLIVYEKDQAGAYFLAELYMTMESGLWKIDLTRQEQQPLQLIPVINRGDITRLNRRSLESLQDFVRSKKAVYQQEAAPSTPSQAVSVPVDAETLEKNIKKEMIVGKVYFDVGNYERARETFENVIAIDPENKEARDYLEKSMSAIARKQQEQELQQQRLQEERLKAEQARIQEEKRLLEEQRKLLEQQKQVAVPPVPEKAVPAEKSVADELFEQTFSQACELYTAGEYRNAMLQFNKALHLRPSDPEVQSYIQKCERAIQVLSE
ncbi:MAG: hypothetical protein C4541_08135 [Candidatus Auribacter fodinae]|uniref:Tetratricopeptide repeat protein n=1 Tax=Candidatus Auribacter fodinae TaxID=2093366 RepID=A0A3A4QWX6_9BACT|nr:MAG: hypothetical protein C4541_08135 [Candidatus Auribacter fodinae]